MLDAQEIGKKKQIAAQRKKLKRQNRAVRTQKLFTKELFNSYHHKECTTNCNYHCITTNKNFLREEKYASRNQRKRRHQSNQNQFP